MPSMSVTLLVSKPLTSNVSKELQSRNIEPIPVTLLVSRLLSPSIVFKDAILLNNPYNDVSLSNVIFPVITIFSILFL